MNRKTPDGAAPSSAYAVGRGRPPLHTRFQKGNTAHLKRRRRAAPNLKASLLAALDRRVPVDEDGRRRLVARRELGIERLAENFARADPYAVKLLLHLLLEGEGRSDEPSAPADFEVADKLVIANLLARLRPA